MKNARILISLLIIITSVACSSKKKDKLNELSEVKSSSTAPSVDTPQQSLLAQAKKLYGSGLYSVARESFESLRDGYPSGPYLEFAEIKIADCHYEERAFDLAAPLYEEFAKAHPNSEATPYMVYRAARSYHQMNRGVGRDSAPLSKALELYGKIATEYSDSPYVKAALEYKEQVVRDLAAHDEFVADFYARKDKDKAAEARSKDITEKWSPLLAETKQEQRTLSAKSATALQQMAAQPVPEVIRRKASSEEAPPSPIQKVECNRQTGEVFVYLNESVQNEKLARGGTITPSNGEIRLTLFKAPYNTGASDCLGNKDIRLSEGVLVMAANSDFDVISVENPPRILLIRAQ